MVLVVVADVEAHGVEAPVVRVRVDARALHRVLGLKVRGDGVQPAREQRRERQVQHGARARCGQERGVEAELHERARERGARERRPVLGREHGARRVDHEVHGEVRELARAAVGIARRRRVHEPDLGGGGQVRVAPALPLCGVVLEVVPAEHAGKGQQNRQVGEDRARLVAARAGRHQVVRRLVHAQKQHVVRDGAPGVGCQEEGPEWCGAQVHGERDLRAYERGGQCGGARVRSHEAFDLGVRFENRHAALGVRVEGGHGERREGCVVFYTDAVGASQIFFG